MNKRLLRVAAYLGSQGLYKEASQMQKLAGEDHPRVDDFVYMGPHDRLRPGPRPVINSDAYESGMGRISDPDEFHEIINKSAPPQPAPGPGWRAPESQPIVDSGPPGFSSQDEYWAWEREQEFERIDKMKERHKALVNYLMEKYNENVEHDPNFPNVPKLLNSKGHRGLGTVGKPYNNEDDLKSAIGRLEHMARRVNKNYLTLNQDPMELEDESIKQIARYLRSQGLYKEASQIKKLAGSADSYEAEHPYGPYDDMVGRVGPGDGRGYGEPARWSPESGKPHPVVREAAARVARLQRDLEEARAALEEAEAVWGRA